MAEDRAFCKPEICFSEVDGIRAWRDNLAALGRFPSDADLNWPESISIECATDKPGFDGYEAVQVWAAYAERTELRRPEEFPTDCSLDPAIALVNRLSSKEFGHIIGPELWLPVEFNEVFEAEEPTGKPCKIGSIFALWRQLQNLNNLTWKATDEVIRGWRLDDFDSVSLESIARWGFSIWFCLTEYAVANRLPMRLDY